MLAWKDGILISGNPPEEFSDSDFSYEENIPTTGVHPSYLPRSSKQTINSSQNVVPSSSKTPAHTPLVRTTVQGKVPRMQASTNQGRRVHRVHRDNPAEARWRKKLPPDSFFDLQVPFLEIAARLSNATKMANASRSSSHKVDLFEPLARIGFRTRTFIRIPSANDRRLEIWALRPADIEAAKRELEVLVHPPRSRQSLASRNGGPRERSMPNVHPITERERTKMTRIIESRAKLEFYRQEPDSADTFASTGMFLWPAKEIHPDQAFGSSHAVLDHLRTRYNCFVTYDAQRSVIRVLTNELDGSELVQEVMKKLRVAFCECAASKSMPLDVYLVSPTSSWEAKITVKLVDSNLIIGAESIAASDMTAVAIAGTKIALLSGPSLQPAACSEWEEEAVQMKARNGSIMDRAIVDTLKRMTYQRGRVQMRTHLGMFVLHKYFSPKDGAEISTKDFMEKLSSSNTRGSLQQIVLKADDIKHLFMHIREAEDFLIPYHSHDVSLEDVLPLYTAMFQFRHGRSESINLHIEASSAALDGGMYESAPQQWTRNNYVNATPLQLYMVPLQGDMTWKLQITIEKALNSHQVPASLSKFSTSVESMSSSKSAIKEGKIELMFKLPNGDMNAYQFQQKTSWRYRIKTNSSYIFEVARYDQFGLARTPSTQGYRVPEKTQWGFSLWCMAWDEKLSGNATLEVGDTATWEPSLEGFFSRNRQSQSRGPNPGFADYLELMRSLVEFLGDATSRRLTAALS